MVTSIISIILGLLIIGLFIRQLKSNDQAQTRIFRLVAVGGTALLIGLLGKNAVATQRIMFGLAGAIVFYESFYLLKLQNKLKAATGLVDLLPIIVPVLFIYPYWSMISYFFGFDRAIFFYSLLVVAAYFLGSKIKNRMATSALHFVLGAISVMMLLWMSVKAFN